MTASRVVLLVSVTTALLAWLVQWGVLGVAFPHWSDGHGLLKGDDASAFNQVAINQAEMIAAQGWSAWQLRPNGWGVSGILSGWYALTWPSPAAFVPVQALLYGIAAGCLFVIFRAITGQHRVAVWGLLPLFFPSSAVIYAQPHRDIFVFFGLMLVLLAWAQWALLMSGDRSARPIPWLLAAVALLVGYGAVWVVRPYAAEVLLAINLLLLALASVLVGLRALQQRRIEMPGLMALSGALVAIVLASQLEMTRSFDQIYAKERAGAEQVADSEQSAAMAEEAALSQHWKSSAWLPSPVDDQFRRLATARDSFAIENHVARSAIDLDRRFGEWGDVIAYTPRALSIGLLAPFPAEWRPHPSAPANRNLERVLAGVEMTVFYGLLPFLIIGVYQWRHQRPLWFALLPAAVWLMVYSYTVPVVGALVRYRFPAYVLILGLALVTLVVCVNRWRGRDEGLR